MFLGELHGLTLMNPVMQMHNWKGVSECLLANGR